jgi:hypothetical protein
MAGQPITLSLPTIGESGPGYATKLLTAITTIETELERKVVPADMDVNADLSFLSGLTNYGAVDLKYAQLTLQDETAVTAAAYPMTVFAGSNDGELYYNDNAGRQVQLTTDGSVNVSTSGGITGSGYGSTGVELRWDSGDNEYELRSGAGTSDYAALRLDDLYLSDGSTNFVRITVPSISADYVITLPTATPASTSLVQMASDGTLSTSRDPSIDTIAVASTSTFTGKATFNAEIAHVQRVRHVSPLEMYSATWQFNVTNDTPKWVCASSGDGLFIPLRLEEGERLEAIVLLLVRSTTVYSRGVQVGYLNSNSRNVQYLTAINYTAGGGGGTYAEVTFDVTDIVVSSPAGTSANQGFLNVYVAGGTSDEVRGAKIKYSRV